MLSVQVCLCCFWSEGLTVIHDRFFKDALWKEHSGMCPFKMETKETEMGMQMIDKEFAFVTHVSSGPGNEVNITLKRHFYSSAKINLSFPF